MKLSWLPSKFALGNFTLVFSILLMFGVFFYLINIIYLYVYVCGAITFYSMVKFHGFRARRHKLLNPPSIAHSLCEIRMNQDQIESHLDNVDLRITLGKTEGG